MSSRELLYRLLHVALHDIRFVAHEGKSRDAFAIAHFFRNIPLKLERAARDEIAYDDILAELRTHAEQLNKSAWFEGVIRNAIPSSMRDCCVDAASTGHPNVRNGGDR
jgi:hypothetical protein